jgi:hypothetical protein
MKSSTASHARLLPFVILLIALPGAALAYRIAPLNRRRYDNRLHPELRRDDLAFRIPGQRHQMARTLLATLRTSALLVDPTDSKMTIAWRQFNNLPPTNQNCGVTTDGVIDSRVFRNNVFQ